MFSGVHDHSDSHCFMKVMEGQLKETLYEWPHDKNVEEPLAVADTNIYKTNEVAYICGKNISNVFMLGIKLGHSRKDLYTNREKSTLSSGIAQKFDLIIQFTRDLNILFYILIAAV